PNLPIRKLGGLQNFTRAFRAGDVRARPHLAPFMERTRHPNLRPNPDNQRDADIKEPTRSETETVWIKHTELNLMYRSQLSLCWLEQIRRSNDCFVHLGRDIAPG